MHLKDSSLKICGDGLLCSMKCKTSTVQLNGALIHLQRLRDPIGPKAVRTNEGKAVAVTAAEIDRAVRGLERAQLVSCARRDQHSTFCRESLQTWLSLLNKVAQEIPKLIIHQAPCHYQYNVTPPSPEL